jgi:hypothetical protein
MESELNSNVTKYCSHPDQECGHSDQIISQNNTGDYVIQIILYIQSVVNNLFIIYKG